jgi:hypothetical protein
MDLGTILALVVCLIIVALVVRENKKDKQASERIEPQPTTDIRFPLKFEADIGCPPARTALASRNASLIKFGPAKGFVFDYATLGDPDDNGSQANRVLGGGTPYGGIYLAGTVHVETDERGQCTANSWVELFGTRKPLTGGVELNGKIGIGSPEMGCGITGQVHQSGIVLGKVFEAGMDVVEGDATWEKLSIQDQVALDGFHTIQDGKKRVEYVHGNFEGRVA